MARVQEYFEPSGLDTPPPLPKSQFLYNLSGSAAVFPEVTMAQPLLQNPLRPEDYMSQSQWSMPPSPMSSSMITPHTPSWVQHVASTGCMAWTGLLNEPLPNQSMFANGNLLYDDSTTRGTLAKSMDFRGPSFWASSDMSNITPSPGADMSLSPVSPFSDAKATYSPGSDYRPATPSQSSASYMMSPGIAHASSATDFAPLTPLSVAQQQPGSRFGVPMTSLGSTHPDNNFKQNDVTSYVSEQSYGHSHGSSPRSTPWLPPGYTVDKSAFSHDSQRQHSSMPAFDPRPNSFLAPLDRNSRQRQAQWSKKGDVPTQDHFQTRFMAPLVDSEKAQRTRDDETLLQMKQNGYTYKDIRKALGRKVAESTLRGRYRSLTKPRKDRVRAPKWSEIDIVLLKRYVQEEFDRLEVTQPSLESRQKPDKVPWMKIVEQIANTGGTYKFGAATAKKKWVEVTRRPSARSSRRRSQA